MDTVPFKSRLVNARRKMLESVSWDSIKAVMECAGSTTLCINGVIVMIIQMVETIDPIGDKEEASIVEAAWVADLVDASQFFHQKLSQCNLGQTGC